MMLVPNNTVVCMPYWLGISVLSVTGAVILFE
jgi:hypothetical protein